MTAKQHKSNDDPISGSLAMPRRPARHKSQGSEWGSVLLFNEARYFRADAQRWLYTGITRSRQQLTIVST